MTTAPEGTHLNISGVYPHLCTYTVEPGESFKLSECGIGAIVPWADRLWMITYGAHHPTGSTHKLYSIDRNLNMTIHPESVGGTPAGRMIHAESNQLILGHYLIDETGKVRVVSPQEMPARVTAIARHLNDPANKVYVVDMEGMIYELNVHTLDFKKLFHKPVPGWHAKGGYTAQGRLVISNNGDKKVSAHGIKGLQVEDVAPHPENAGVLAQWDGETWEIVERRQYCDVTAPAGIRALPDDGGPLWAIGWDRRSLRLKLLDEGKWRTFLLPKAAHNNDPRHGWFTEWPRIREIGGGRMMMDMHGMFYRFPKGFSAANTSGIAPISSHIRYIPDFCDWNGQLVIASDESTIMQNPHCGQPQSNLWFGELDDLKRWGPASGYGGPWVLDRVQAGVPSDPFLVAGFDRRVLHVVTSRPAGIAIEIDADGSGTWNSWRTVKVDGYTTVVLPGETMAQWVRLTSDRDVEATAYWHCTTATFQTPNHELFAGVAGVAGPVVGGLLYPEKETRGLALLGQEGEDSYRVSRDLEFGAVERDLGLAGKLAARKDFRVDEASVIVTDGKTNYRLPKGNSAFDQPFSFGWPRGVREVESERNLANIHGTFYEVPRSGHKIDPDWERMRPVSSHGKAIHDFCTWQGLLVLSGVNPDAESDGHLFRGSGGGALWFGAIDDLWQLGKPMGQGGPWKETAVKAGQPSDPYLMTGYDRKTLRLLADRDTTVTAQVNVDHQSGWHVMKLFALQAGKPLEYRFPAEYSAHWIRFQADSNCTATAWLTYD